MFFLRNASMKSISNITRVKNADKNSPVLIQMIRARNNAKEVITKFCARSWRGFLFLMITLTVWNYYDCQDRFPRLSCWVRRRGPGAIDLTDVLPPNGNAMPVELSIPANHGTGYSTDHASNDPIHVRVLGILSAVVYILDQQFGHMDNTRSHLLRTVG